MIYNMIVDLVRVGSIDQSNDVTHCCVQYEAITPSRGEYQVLTFNAICMLLTIYQVVCVCVPQ